jgi:anti-sigma B factor antagonist
MAGHRRLAITEVGPVTVVRFADRRILDEANIQEIGQELYQLVEEERRDQLLLNLCDVDFLASSALGKLITLQRKVKARGGTLKLSNVRPEIYEVFAITRLNAQFDIRDDEQEALAAFQDGSSSSGAPSSAKPAATPAPSPRSPSSRSDQSSRPDQV